MTPTIRTPFLGRMHALFPREHGAWGMMLIPLLTAAGVVGRWDLPLTLFLVALLALFFLRAPLQVLLKERLHGEGIAFSQADLLLVAAVYAVIAGVSSLALLVTFERPALLLFGFLAVSAFAVQETLNGARKHRVKLQAVGGVAMSSTAAAGYYVLTGNLDRVALALWLLNALFTLNQILHVQARIHLRNILPSTHRILRARTFLPFLALTWAGVYLLARAEFLPPAALVAFVPFTVYALAWFTHAPRPVNVRQLGWAHLSMALVFAGLVIGSFRWPVTFFSP